jgi:hypothetical protein
MDYPALLVVGLLAASTALHPASAATIEYKDNIDGPNVVAVTGEIERGDSDRFDQVTALLAGPTVVFLSLTLAIFGRHLNNTLSTILSSSAAR